ncbi:MAG TPA: hypothetical protein VJY62_04485 [Bacteroidia bacterium]|nr:hypothetical protein [Bacteroidia bacterium]
MRDYPEIAIEKWCDYISGNDDARRWLEENNFRELAEFWDAYENIEQSFQWLKSNGFLHLAACIDAANHNSKAKLWLLKYGYTDLAAFCDASEGNQHAVSILLQNEKYQLVRVARTIYSNHKKKKRSFWRIFDFGNPFK